MRHILLSFFVIAVLAVPWLMLHPEQAHIVYSFIGSAERQIASVIISHKPKSVTEIKNKYSGLTDSRSGVGENKVRILLVPGHEPDYGGAEYANLLERDMVVDLAEQLRQFMTGNNKYEVFVARDKDYWSSTFSNYFDKNWNEIIEWTKNNQEETSRLTRIGEFHPVISKVIHNVAPRNIAYRLYGMSKWSNENDVDIIIHIHFNDHPGHGMNSPGKYTGFSIYIPEGGYYNSTTTRSVASSIFSRLKKYNPVSNFPGEKAGIVETQDLIAVGAYNSLNAPSLLIEYGYIYETQFSNPEVYDLAIKDLAFQTYLGLQDFFDDKSPANLFGRFDTLMMPYAWNKNINEGENNPRDIYSLQTALIFDGVYPPNNKSLNDCPRTGTFGNCTKSAVELFQKKRGVIGEYGAVGDKTLRELNSSYSFSLI